MNESRELSFRVPFSFRMVFWVFTFLLLVAIVWNAATTSTSDMVTFRRPALRMLVVEIQRRLTVTAIALKRYQLRHGKYPADLAALTPEFIREVPLDPMDGKPLRYRLLKGRQDVAQPPRLFYSLPPPPTTVSNGKAQPGAAVPHNESEETFVLYSVGGNRQDDGGDPMRLSPNLLETVCDWPMMLGRDIVWPMPVPEVEFVEEVIPFATSSGQALSTGAQGRRQAMIFDHSDLRKALELLAKRAGMKLILPKELEGTVHGRLTDIPIERAIRIILERKGYALEKAADGWRAIKGVRQLFVT